MFIYLSPTYTHMTITNTMPNTITNTITNTKEEKKTNTTPVVKNKANKNKINKNKAVHPRNPLSYPYEMHRLPTEW